ncbi:hypothetical protein AB0D49_29335 [Streptomyces sp. NPDC048290]
MTAAARHAAFIERREQTAMSEKQKGRAAQRSAVVLIGRRPTLAG